MRPFIPRAITTTYKGYRFRSRLEARYAVLLDYLEEPWEYEPEGFEMAGGRRYLPDFRLPRLDLWLEVKPNLPTNAERSLNLELQRGLNQGVIIARGLPEPRSNNISAYYFTSVYGETWRDDCYFATDAKGKLCIGTHDKGSWATKYFLGGNTNKYLALQLPRIGEMVQLTDSTTEVYRVVRVEHYALEADGVEASVCLFLELHDQ